MAKRKWIFLSNTFEVQTRGTNRRMLSLATSTDSKLAAETSDSMIAGIYNDYHPVFAIYRQLYEAYAAATGEHKGNTLNVRILLEKTLASELRRLEGAVRNVYIEDRHEEVAIFPNKRTPFFHGTYEERISAVGSLAKKLNDDPLMAAATLQAQSLYNLLLGARNMQLQKEGLVGELSDVLENQRKLVAEALWGIVLGRLMEKFRKTPSEIERFFDFTLLRKRKKKEEAGSGEEMRKIA